VPARGKSEAHWHGNGVYLETDLGFLVGDVKRRFQADLRFLDYIFDDR